MIIPNITAYLYLELNPTRKVKGVEVERKVQRYDVLRMTGYCPTLERLKNIKSELFFYLIQSDKNEQRKKGSTTPEHYLQCRPPKSKTVNFSGLRFQFMENKQLKYASGEASQKETLKGGLKNPLHEIRNDGFLFIFGDNMQTLEILIISDARHVIDAYRKQLSIGGFDEVLERLRHEAKEINPL